MASSFLGRGYRVTVWNRTAGKADESTAGGAGRATTVHDALAASELVVLSLTDHDAMYAVLGSATEALSGRVLVDLGSHTASVDHVLETARDAGVDTSLPQTVLEIFRRGAAASHADDSVTSLIEILKTPAEYPCPAAEQAARRAALATLARAERLRARADTTRALHRLLCRSPPLRARTGTRLSRPTVRAQRPRSVGGGPQPPWAVVGHSSGAGNVGDVCFYVHHQHPVGGAACL